MDKVIDVTDVYNILDSLEDLKMNPVDGSTCMYTGPDGNHCIAGEILHRLGFHLPTVGDVSNTVSIDEMIYAMGYDRNFTNEAISMLGAGQRIADDLSTDNEITAWAEAKKAMIRWMEVWEYQ